MKISTVAVTFIAISGASGSGKTLFAKTIVDEIKAEVSSSSVSILHEDAYYNDQSHLSIEERENQNYDHPDAYDHNLLLEHLHELKAGRGVNSPLYDFPNHTRAREVQAVAPAQVFLVEGILLLHKPSLQAFFDARVFIDTPLDICLTRRIKRDMEERGRSFDSVVEQYTATVRPMYHQFVEPSRNSADVIVPHGGKNRVALDIIKQRVMSLIQA